MTLAWECLSITPERLEGAAGKGRPEAQSLAAATQIQITGSQWMDGVAIAYFIMSLKPHQSKQR